MRTRIRNWSKFQHYKFRSPPWIKLYRDILDDSDWYNLPGEAAKGLIMLWLIASEEDGYLPDSKTLAFRLRISENRVNALLSECSAWFEHDASSVLAECKQDAIPEKSRDREETEERRKGNGAASQQIVPVVVWLQFVEMRKKIRKPLTEHGSELIWKKLAHLKEQGNDPVEVIEQSIVNSWAGVFPIGGDREPNSRKSFDAIREENNKAALRAVLEHHRSATTETSGSIPEGTKQGNTLDLPGTTGRFRN